MKKIIAIAALSAALSTSAFAAGNNAYVFAEAGSASLGNAQTPTGNSSYPSPLILGVGAGYRFTPNFATEVGYHSMANSTVTGTGFSQTLKVSSITLAAVGSHSIDEQLSIFGKLGLAMNKLDATSTVAGATAKSSKNNMYFAVGGQYNITAQFALRVQYENFGDFTPNNVVNTTSQSAASVFGIAGVMNF